MESADILTLIGRLVQVSMFWRYGDRFALDIELITRQILLGAMIVGFNFALVGRVDEDYYSYYYYGSDYCLLFAAGMLGINVILFGALGVFAFKLRFESKRYFRLHLAVLILDLLSFIFCITASVVSG